MKNNITNKNQIRKVIKSIRENLTLEEVQQFSENIFENFIKMDLFKNSQVILSYMSFKNEVSTEKLNDFILKNNKILLLPKVIDDENMIAVKSSDNFYKNSLGILEPSGEEYTDKIDLIIIPGIAYDNFGNRVGFGKGYYDRFLKKYPDILKVALAYNFQLVDNKIDSNEFDIKIPYIVFEDKLFIL